MGRWPEVLGTRNLTSLLGLVGVQKGLVEEVEL